tara:strand:+ start:164 stop:418 length:255 start_codon:yes stop_codon:yes gene_type:complete
MGGQSIGQAVGYDGNKTKGQRAQGLAAQLNILRQNWAARTLTNGDKVCRPDKIIDRLSNLTNNADTVLHENEPMTGRIVQKYSS